MRQAESVTLLSRSRMATRSGVCTVGSVSPAMFREGVAVTWVKVAPPGDGATGRRRERWDESTRSILRPRGATIPYAVHVRRLAGALALLALACGTGTITAPGGSTGGPPPPANRAPVMTVPPNATTNPITEGTAVLFSVTADDPDGDSLSYAWTQTAPSSPVGTFSSRTVRNPTWTSPALTADTVFTFLVTASDGQGASVSQSFQLTVNHVVVNRPPNVSSIMVSPSSPVAGDVVTLSVTATDPDGDPLTIAWTQTAPAQQGTFGTPTQASTTWISPPIGVSSVGFSFRVTVTDGKNPLHEELATVTVTLPAYGADIQPIWDAHCTGCHPSDGQLDLTMGNSYGQLVNVAQVGSGSCAGDKRVDTSMPSQSSLLGWLAGTCGTRMPENAGPLSSSDLVKVQSWVLGGAPGP